MSLFLISCFNRDLSDLPEKIYFENDICKCPEAFVGETKEINGITYKVVDDLTVFNEVNNGNINLCTTLVTDMSELFKDNTSFNSNINFWDTSNVIDMSYMFSRSFSFNQDISKWNTSKLVDMEGMFLQASSFNQYIGNWETSIVKNMSRVFREASSFNKDIENWDVSNVNSMSQMFMRATEFNQLIVEIGILQMLTICLVCLMKQNHLIKKLEIGIL